MRDLPPIHPGEQLREEFMKPLAYPDSQDVPHWRRELIAWWNDRAAM